ncbi:MAG TPA: exodeoxyribonuclease VII small subunit [Firmicutes bacterium]|nr:exodeoxyribonuclease VII small subunit [Bacillota bacterium]
MAKKKIDKETKKSFEEYLREIEDIAEKLESGETGLDEAIALYEKGMELSIKCSKALKEAKLKVEILKKRKQDETIAEEETGEDEEDENGDEEDEDGRLPF